MWTSAKFSNGSNDRDAIVSDCGRYSVARHGSATGRKTYEAYRRKGHPLGPMCLERNLSSADTAKLRCEADAKMTLHKDEQPEVVPVQQWWDK